MGLIYSPKSETILSSKAQATCEAWTVENQVTSPYGPSTTLPFPLRSIAFVTLVSKSENQKKLMSKTN